MSKEPLYWSTPVLVAAENTPAILGDACAIKVDCANLPDKIGEIYQRLFDSGAHTLYGRMNDFLVFELTKSVCWPVFFDIIADYHNAGIKLFVLFNTRTPFEQDEIKKEELLAWRLAHIAGPSVSRVKARL